MTHASTPAAPPGAPLAERLRPRTLDEIAGQAHLLAPGRPLRRAVEQDSLRSIILWGPPGVGKTTLARVVAATTRARFISLSAVSAGVKDVREAVQAARQAQALGARTILFLDEVHRFNKAQQDFLLPFVEDGTLTLIGATTENPSFEVIGALRSRSRIFVLQALSEEDIGQVLARALEHPEGFAGRLSLDEEVLALLAAWADGDARRALNALEAVAAYAQGGQLDAETAREVLGRKGMALDKGGEHFYNLTSALHKSVRGCDPDAALYWLARLLVGGADLMVVARRLVRIASEDVGLADPGALRLALAARDAARFLGAPEGELALAEAAVYLALAPKSNAVYRAWGAAKRDAEGASFEVPLHLRNAPTALMKGEGYGRGYLYYHDAPEASFKQPYRPPELAQRYYDAAGEGWEGKVRERLERFARLKEPS
ncbi:MAG: replication-associated recombination protein A [Deinococcota bacterium]|nr:replication-associated recombination protein A [Deinococcota bacterium]